MLCLNAAISYRTFTQIETCGSKTGRRDIASKNLGGDNGVNLQFDQTLAIDYSSRSQMIRVLTEEWVKNNIYCPRCGSPEIQHFPNNSAVADFFCPNCGNEYELKSKSGVLGHKIADGAYDTFIRRITSYNNPDFFILNYNADKLCVENVWMIPKHFFVPEVVEKRKPLSPVAQRAGWTGCNILLDKIPEQGRIRIIYGGIPEDKETVLEQVRRSSLLSTDSLEARGWLMDVLDCINRIQKQQFTLEDIYRFEWQLADKHPKNHNIRAKIRQQLQLLRDKGFIAFVGRGIYRKE